MVAIRTNNNHVSAAHSSTEQNVHKMVVLPALSRPRMRIRTCLEPNRDVNRLENHMPMVAEAGAAKVGSKLLPAKLV